MDDLTLTDYAEDTLTVVPVSGDEKNPADIQLYIQGNHVALDIPQAIELAAYLTRFVRENS